MTITVRQAQLDTVQVDVHAIRVGRKQMTQAVFRQLLPEHPFDFEKEELRGDLWGTVNYFWKGCDEDRGYETSHLHLVWQRDNELRRCCVYEPGYCHERSIALNNAKQPITDLLTISFLRRVLQNPDSITEEMWSVHRNQWSLAGWHCTIGINTATKVGYVLEAVEAPPENDAARRDLEKDKADIAREMIRLEGKFEDKPIADDGQIALLIKKCGSKIKSIEDSYGVFYDIVCDLPQLFIAV